MNKYDYDEAKKIYIKHNGNYFYMDRGDFPLLEKYKAFAVPKDLEREWDKEIVNNKKNLINKESNMNKLQMLCSSLIEISTDKQSNIDMTGLTFVYDVFTKKRFFFDTFTNLRLIESIFEKAKKFVNVDRKRTLAILKESLDFLIELEDKQIIISKDYYNTDGSKPDYLQDNNIKQRMQQRIKEFSDLYYKLKEKNQNSMINKLTSFIKKPK